MTPAWRLVVGTGVAPCIGCTTPEPPVRQAGQADPEYHGAIGAGPEYAATQAATLSERSLDMFLAEWRRKGYVSENYSSVTGPGDDRRLSSDPFHSWGVRFGIMAFIEDGLLAGPEEPLSRDGSGQASGGSLRRRGR